MIDARFVPIEVWPGEKRKVRRDSPFRGSWKNTLDTLERELGHLKAKDILVQAYLGLADIRNDGWPKAAARPSEPGVVVSFKTPGGDIRPSINFRKNKDFSNESNERCSARQRPSDFVSYKCGSVVNRRRYQ